MLFRSLPAEFIGADGGLAHGPILVTGVSRDKYIVPFEIEVREALRYVVFVWRRNAVEACIDGVGQVPPGLSMPKSARAIAVPPASPGYHASRMAGR